MLHQIGSQLGSSTLTLAALVLVLIGLAHVLLRWWVRRQASTLDVAAATAAGVEQRQVHRWLRRGLTETLPPLVLLLWIHGLYFTLNVLLPRLDLGAVSSPANTTVRWAYALTVVYALFWLLARVGRLLEAFFLALAVRSETSWDDLLLPLAGRAIRRTLPLMAIILAAPVLSLSPALSEIVRNLSSVLLIGVIALILYQAVDLAASFVTERHRIDVSDNLRARAIYTQVTVLKKVAVTVIGIFTLASMLMVFDSVRQFGASILASAGIAGIVLGFAAQRSIATLLAGFQIAITQPIRVDDVVIVESEFGNIEDITLTYVVVRLWDLRRLVVPITHFIEHPFQNWTRTSADVLGTVFLYLDYRVPVDALRAELTRILQASTLWDGKVNVLQVTEATEAAVQVRALASASNASRAWDLRCEIREKLITFVQRDYPDSLPRVRATLNDREALLAVTGR